MERWVEFGAVYFFTHYFMIVVEYWMNTEPPTLGNQFLTILAKLEQPKWMKKNRKNNLNEHENVCVFILQSPEIRLS